MVVKIQPPGATMAGTLLYNQRKVEGGVARILCAVNIPSAFPEDIRETFSRYERRNRSSDCVSFQLSVNPDPSRAGERLSDQEVREFASALMKGLGYGSQPYVVYEHRDIDRTHYHVVSIRTDWEGRKIKDYREQYRCQQLLKQHAQQFHYLVGKEGGPKKRPDGARPMRFDPKAGDICNQYLSLFQEAAGYRFSTLPQLKAVCASKGLIMDTRDTPAGPDILLQGTGPDGKPVARMIGGQEMKAWNRYPGSSGRGSPGPYRMLWPAPAARIPSCRCWRGGGSTPRCSAPGREAFTERRLLMIGPRLS